MFAARLRRAANGASCYASACSSGRRKAALRTVAGALSRLRMSCEHAIFGKDKKFGKFGGNSGDTMGNSGDTIFNYTLTGKLT